MINFFTNGGGSGQIRGWQIAKRLKANVNPKIFDPESVCIFIKDYPTKDIPTHAYIDVVEDSRGLRWVVNHPEVGIIASSKMIYDYLRTKTRRDDIVLIPQHHCNFERYVRPAGEVKVAGIIGNAHTYQADIKELKKELKKIGVELKTLIKKKFKDRKEVCEFYKKIDVQIVFRTDMNLRNPLKLINAMSFGIPTVAYPEPCFDEFPISYLPAKNLERIIFQIKDLKMNPDLYRAFAIEGINESQDYHIDFISQLYLQLK